MSVAGSRVRSLGLAAALVVSAGLGPLAAPAAAAKVSCGQSISQDTKVGNDLNNCPGDGLVVVSDGVVLNLNGHTIDGNNSGGGDGIVIGAGVDNVTVKNGKIRQFDDGVFLSENSGNRLSGLTLIKNGKSTNGDGLDSFLSDDMRLQDIRALENGDDGVTVSGVGAVLKNVSGDRNGEDGIETFGSNARIEDSRAVDNGDEGLFATTPNNFVSDFLARGNKDGGGIRLGASNILIRGVALDNAEQGIRVEDSDAEVLNSTAKDNVGDGIIVFESASDVLLKGNTANRNDEDGIDVDSSSTRLRGNTANDNELFGIDAVPGVVDLGGNKASGNDAGQCNNVDCD